MNWLDYLLFFGGGLLAGVINTLAGNGSAITLSLLIFTGMPANVANGTNRIGALVQTVTAVLSLRRTARTRFLFRSSVWFFLPGLIGSILGAWIAIDIDEALLKRIIGVIMLLLLFTMLYSPRRWATATQIGRGHRSVINWMLMFLVGLYGGFIQMGIGVFLLALLVLVARYSLRDANIIKLVVAMVFVIPAFLVFALSGTMEWIPGLVLALGQGIGAWIGARYILFLPSANFIVKILLLVILSISSVSLLQIPQWIANLW